MDIPATGFSIGLNILLSALERQGFVFEKPETDSLVCYEKSMIKTAYKIGEELKNQGLIMEIDICNLDMDQAIHYAKSKNIGGILYIKDIIDIENNGKRTVSMGELLGGGEEI